MLKNCILENKILPLDPIISGTKCDRNKLMFMQKEGVNPITMRHTIGTKSDHKSQKGGSSPHNLPTMPYYGSTYPRRELPIPRA